MQVGQVGEDAHAVGDEVGEGDIARAVRREAVAVGEYGEFWVERSGD